MDNTNQIITKELNEFLHDRKEKFPTITKKQKEEWENAIKKEIIAILDDSDIFYDTIPEEIEEI